MASLCQHCATLAHSNTAGPARRSHSLPVTSLFTWKQLNKDRPPSPPSPPPAFTLFSCANLNFQAHPWPSRQPLSDSPLLPPSPNWGSPKNIKSLVQLSVGCYTERHSQEGKWDVSSWTGRAWRILHAFARNDAGEAETGELKVPRPTLPPPSAAGH